MPPRILLDRPLSWRQLSEVADGAPLALSQDAQERIRAARTLVDSIVRKGVRAYGVNTGVGALCDVVVNEAKQAQLSRNIVMSHAVGVGPALEAPAGDEGYRQPFDVVTVELAESIYVIGEGVSHAATVSIRRVVMSVSR